MFTKSNSKANRCAKEIINWLIKRDLWRDVTIYVDNGRYTFKNTSPHKDEIEALLNDEKIIPEIVWEEGFNPKEYFDYVCQPHFLSMSFEGYLYEALNYSLSPSYCDTIDKELSDIFRKYGYYYELGNSWNLSTAKI